MKNGIEEIVDPNEMNQKALKYTVIIGGVALFAYFSIWGFRLDFEFGFFWRFYIGILIGVVFHEVLHAIGFMIFGKAKMKDIKFGVIWKHITPYAHCKVPLKINAYRIALLLPFILTGIIPLIIALSIGNGLLFSLAVFLIVGGIGDWIIFRKIRKYHRTSLISDHHSAIGCIVYKEEIFKDAGSN
jgi:hypothetical protein